MTLSIVIPAYNEEEYVGHCIKSILAQGEREARLIEIIVVDNASTDRTAKIAAEFPKVRVVHEPDKGVTRARQRGLSEAKGELVGFVDADSAIDPGWLNRAFNTFESDREVVCLSGPVYFEGMARPKQMMVEMYSNMTLATSKVTGFMVFGSNFVARRAALEAIGGFDTSIDFYGDDTNIARRLSKVGRVFFASNFRIKTSPRRLHKEGMVRAGLKYISNYLAEAIFKKPISKKYEDIR